MTIHANKIGYGIACLAALVSLAQTGGSPGFERFRAGVAGIEVRKEGNRANDNGSGFVVSVEGGEISILTARHLFFDGKERFTENVWVTLFLDRIPRKATFFKESPNLDLAVLKVSDVPASIVEKLPAYSFRSKDAKFSIGDTIHVFGGESQQWQVPSNSISDPSDADSDHRFRFTGIGVRGGYSGAAILDHTGRLIAVHLGSTDNEESYGHAQIISDAYPVLKRLGVAMNKLTADDDDNPLIETKAPPPPPPILFEADYSGNKIFAFAPDGSKSKFVDVNTPYGLAFDATGNLFVGTGGKGQILKFTRDRAQYTFDSELKSAQGLAFDTSGNLYVGDEVHNQILKFAPNGGQKPFATDVGVPQDLAFDASPTFAFLIDKSAS